MQDSGGPCEPGLRGEAGECLSATAGFFLGRAGNLDGVLPHCVFLLLEDPGRREGIASLVGSC